MGLKRATLLEEIIYTGRLISGRLIWPETVQGEIVPLAKGYMPATLFMSPIDLASVMEFESIYSAIFWFKIVHLIALYLPPMLREGTLLIWNYKT